MRSWNRSATILRGIWIILPGLYFVPMELDMWCHGMKWKSICTWILELWQSLRMISARKNGRMLRQSLEILQVETILLKVPEIQHAVELVVQELPEIHLEVEAVREVVTSRRNLPTVEAMRMTKNFRPFLSVPLVR